MTGNKSLSSVITIIFFGLCCAIGIVAYDQFINTTKTDIAKSNAKTLWIWLEKHRSINQISHLSGSELCVNLDANGCLADQLSAALKSGNLINIRNPFQLGSEAPLVVFGKYKALTVFLLITHATMKTLNFLVELDQAEDHSHLGLQIRKV